ncbi:MAG: hypothetical protein ACREHD_09855, partial [Pirellulales bacterium]
AGVRGAASAVALSGVGGAFFSGLMLARTVGPFVPWRALATVCATAGAVTAFGSFYLRGASHGELLANVAATTALYGCIGGAAIRIMPPRCDEARRPT